MSLKAKLESVIYAAEEPVTMAQLVVLFTQEALEYKAEQEAAAKTAAEGEGSPDGAVAAGSSDEIDYAALTEDPGATTADVAAAITAEAEAAEVSGQVEEVPTLAVEDEAAELQPMEESGEQSAEIATEPSESDLKREAKQRDREVRAVLRRLLDELVSEYASDDRGVEIREIAGGFRMATKPEYHDVVRAFVKSLKPALKLSLPALETLAVVAYKQPVTAPEVNEIRGVDSSGVFGSLLARKLIATAGRKPVIGRPILYKTTKEFLLRFGLKDLSELPSMEEFEKMAAMELEESEVEGAEAEQQAQPELNEDMSVEQEAGDEFASNDLETETREESADEPAEAPPTQ